MFGQEFWDALLNGQLAEQQQLQPLAPFQAPPGTAYMPPNLNLPPKTDIPEVTTPFNPDAWNKRTVPQTSPSPHMYDGPMQGASMGGGVDLSGLLGRLGPSGDFGGGSPSGGGGLLGLGGSKYGPMLMALGGGIAGGANQGWGAGIGSGLTNAATVRMRSEENAQEDAYRQQILKAKLAEMAKGEPGTDDMREFEFAKRQGFKGGFMDYMTTKSRSNSNAPSGFEETEDGSLRFRKGGPNDPDVIAKESLARGRGADVPQTVRSDAIKADQAYKSLMQSLDDYQTTVEKSGHVVVPGKEKSAVIRKRRNIQLQMKELYNLGVLNGPDMMLMDEMLYDPTNSLNPASQNFGLDPGSRVKDSVRDIKEMMRQQRNSKTQAIGMPDIPAAAQDDDPFGVR